MIKILIFIAIAVVASGASVAFYFVGRRAGKFEFARYLRKNPKPLGEEEFFGISKEIDRRIGTLQKWISVRKGTKDDVSGACLELMRLYDLRQYLSLAEMRDRAAARLYARDFLDKRRDEIYDLYDELFGLGARAERAVERVQRQNSAGQTAQEELQTEASGAATETSSTVGNATPNPAPQTTAPATVENTMTAPAPNGGK